MNPAARAATEAWQEAYQRTDLVARLGFAALSDYRRAGTPLNLPAPIETQLDRFDQAHAIEQEKQDLMDHTRGDA